MKIMKINDATIYEQSVTTDNDDEDNEYIMTQQFMNKVWQRRYDEESANKWNRHNNDDKDDEDKWCNKWMSLKKSQDPRKRYEYIPNLLILPEISEKNTN